MNVFIIFIAFFSLVSANSDRFDEELFVKPLKDGFLYNYFQFTTTDSEELDSKRHYDLFPKSLGEVLSKYGVLELHLTLTQSRWRYESWGFPMEDAATGAQLWIWFKERTRNIDAQWTELINVLSGLFCASLNFMDATNTVIPHVSFRPFGLTSYTYDRFASKNIRYAALPGENVCTENLTPWKKLLPCGSRAGLATLLNALRLHESSYHSLGVHFRRICQDADCLETAVELRQTVSAVFDTRIINPSGGQGWSLRKLYERMLKDTCALATHSSLYVDVTANKTSGSLSLKPEPTRLVEFSRGKTLLTYAVYDISDFVSDGRVLHLEAQESSEASPQSPPVLYSRRFQTGYGQEKGGVTCLLYNNHPKRALSVAYLEVIPWFLRVYYHTLKIETFPKVELVSAFANGTAIKPDQTHYRPGRARERPYHLELVFTLPPASVTRLSFEFERALLKWTEYPPDANHGFAVGSAVVSALVPTARQLPALQQNASLLRQLFDDESQEWFVRMSTEGLLVTLPTPDFSMPYNVICLACTVLAIAFGSIHNLTTRRFRVQDPKTASSRGLLNKLRALIGKKSSAGDTVAEKAENVPDKKADTEIRSSTVSDTQTTPGSEDKDTALKQRSDAKKKEKKRE